MATWSTPPVFVPLQTLTDTVMNALSTDLSALWPYTTAGDLAYAVASDELTRLALGTQYYHLQAGATGLNWIKGRAKAHIPFGNMAETIPTGQHEGVIHIPCNCTIEEYHLVVYPSGTFQVDLWITNYTDYDAFATHPANGDSICGGNEPAVSGAVKATDATLSGWSPNLLEDDYIFPYVDNVVTCKWALLTLQLFKKES